MDVFAHVMGGHESWLFRPAIEDHQQNYDWRRPYNRFVEGLRNTMLAWIDSNSGASGKYVEGLFRSGSEIVERVAVHLIDQRFEALRSMVPNALSPSFFNSGHRHELYLFLKSHFKHFTEVERQQPSTPFGTYRCLTEAMFHAHTARYPAELAFGNCWSGL